MYEALTFCAVLLAATPLPFRAASPVVSAASGRPNIVETVTFRSVPVAGLPCVHGRGDEERRVRPGRQRVLYKYERPYRSGRAFRVSPAGTFAFAPNVAASDDVYNAQQLIYARNSFWTVTGNAVSNINLYGDVIRNYALGKGNTGEALAVGPDGNIYGTGQNGSGKALVFRIDEKGVVATRPLPYSSSPQAPLPLTFGSDGKLYFGIPHPGGIGRVERNGSITFFPANADLADIALASTNGSVYFSALTPSATGSFIRTFASIAPSGGAIKNILLKPEIYPNNIAVDHEGNIWIEGLGTALYEYEVGSNSFLGPITIPDANYRSFSGGSLTIGPDDNVYFFTGFDNYTTSFGAYIQHVQTLQPSGVTLTMAQAASFTIRETRYAGPWSAKSGNPAVAVVSASSANGVFKVTPIGRGGTSLAVADRFGNVSYEAVTVR